jgi:hypothetical protein
MPADSSSEPRARNRSRHPTVRQNESKREIFGTFYDDPQFDFSRQWCDPARHIFHVAPIRNAVQGNRLRPAHSATFARHVAPPPTGMPFADVL